MVDKKKVFVMLSGGVDSSVAAYLLKRQGFDVVGVYFKRYKPDGDKSVCQSDGRSAELVAKKLGIEFKVYDFEREYKERVFDYMIDGYKSCKTPNPDIVCNKEIKFGLFAKRAFSEGADFISSGHYARVSVYVKVLSFLLSLDFLPRRIINLLRDWDFLKSQIIFTFKEAKDKNKDQSYFLSQVSPELLDRIIFPLSQLKKSQVRKIAKKAGLHTAERKDSQGICFIGKKVKLKDFLKRYIDVKEGEVLSLDLKPLGKHCGAPFYTIGERRGFKLAPEKQNPNAEPLFVVSKSCKKNTLIVANKDELLSKMSKIKIIKIKSLNIFIKPKESKEYMMRIRHRGEKTKVRLLDLNDDYARLELLEPAFAPSEGQFAALYEGGALQFSGEIDELAGV